MEITGSAKYDLEAISDAARDRAANVLTRLSLPVPPLVLLGGSTWPGEEAALLDIYRAAKPAHPNLLLVLVPRHAERREEVLREIADRNLSVIQRSQFPDDAPPCAAAPDVLLVDTTGELRGFYEWADVIFVGKSLTQTGGQNPVEPAYAQKAVVTGPHLENFPAIAADFLSANALVQAADTAALQSAILRLLGDSVERERLGSAAADLVRQKAGATRRMVERCREELAHHETHLSTS